MQVLSKFLFFSAGLICVFVAAYLVWAKERKERMKLEEYLGRPDFKIDIQRAWRSTDIYGRYLLLQIAVTNRSVATAMIERFDIRVLGEVGWDKGRGWTDVDKTSTFAMVREGTNQLVQKDKETPDLSKILTTTALVRGQQVHGYLEFYFEKLREYGGSIKIELSLTDALGGAHIQEAETPYNVDRWIG